jgi:hypothetical protein
MGSQIQKLVTSLVTAIRDEVKGELDGVYAAEVAKFLGEMRKVAGSNLQVFAAPTKKRGRPPKAAAAAKPAKRAKKDGRSGAKLCYFPGCKNGAAPRFSMFCAAEHKDLSKSEKNKYRAQHAGTATNGAAPAKAKRGRKAKSKNADVKKSAKAAGKKNAAEKKQEAAAPAN